MEMEAPFDGLLAKDEICLYLTFAIRKPQYFISQDKVACNAIYFHIKVTLSVTQST